MKIDPIKTICVTTANGTATHYWQCLCLSYLIKNQVRHGDQIDGRFVLFGDPKLKYIFSLYDPEDVPKEKRQEILPKLKEAWETILAQEVPLCKNGKNGCGLSNAPNPAHDSCVAGLLASTRKS